MELDSVDQYIFDLDSSILPTGLYQHVIDRDKYNIIDFLEEDAIVTEQYNKTSGDTSQDLIHKIFNFNQKLKLAYDYYLQKKCLCPLKIPWDIDHNINDNNSLHHITQAKLYRYIILYWYPQNCKTFHCFDNNNKPYDISNFRYLVSIVTGLLQNQKLKKQMKCIPENYNANNCSCT